MTDYFVDDAAVGTGDGLSWVNAWTSSALITGISGAGNRLLFASTHDEAVALDITINSSGTQGSPLLIFSANVSDSTYLKGAKLSTISSAGNDMVLAGTFQEWNGFILDPFDDITMGTTDSRAVFNDCDFSQGQNSLINSRIVGNANGSYIEFNDCLFTLVNGSTVVNMQPATHVVFNGGAVVAVSGSIANFAISGTSDRTARAEVNGMDLSDVTNLMIVGTGGSLTGDFYKCSLKSGYTLVSPDQIGFGFSKVTVRECAVGTLTAAAFIDQSEEDTGTTITTTSVYRTGGADDGEQANPVSQEMTTFLGFTDKQRKSVSFDIAAHVATNSTSKTYTVHVAHDAIGSGTAGKLQDDEFWLEVLGPSNNATPTAHGFHSNTLPGIGKTATDLTTESGQTWNTSGPSVGTKESQSITYTNEIEGLVAIRCHFATGDDISDRTIYVDPKIVVS